MLRRNLNKKSKFTESICHMKLCMKILALIATVSISAATASEEENNQFKELILKQQQIATRKIFNLKDSETDFLIFISSSMKDAQVKQLLEDAKALKGTLVIRGLVNNSMPETINYVSKFVTEEGEGIMIDPNQFREFKIESVPTFVLSQEKCNDNGCKIQYDKISGIVTPKWALEKFSESGDLKEEAKKRLMRSQ